MARLLTSLKFQSGQLKGSVDTIIFPLFTKLGISQAISIGPQAGNMADTFNYSHDDLITRQEEFLSKNNLNSLSQAYFSTVPGKDDAIIVDITKTNTSGKAVAISADVVFTQMLSTPLIHKPADCPTAIIFAKKEDLPVLGLAHLGRPQVNKRVTEQAIDHLTNFYQVKLEDIFIGISPSIGPNHYFVKAKDQADKHFIDQKYWDKFAWKDTLSKEEIIRIDVLGKILSILKQKGIPDENIEAYGHVVAVDTYHLASLTPPVAFSHRYAVETNQPQKNGRFMVAAQL